MSAVWSGLQKRNCDTVLAERQDTLNGHGWELAVDCLHELLTTPQVPLPCHCRSASAGGQRRESGAIQHTLKPGWMWTTAYTDLIEEGKRLRQAIDAITPTQAPAPEQPPF